MTRVLVIADDLSGAAEMAGIALRHGLPTRLVREPPAAEEVAGPSCIVIDTDSRSLPPADATRRVTEFAAPLADAGFDLVYKKTDSALRGPIRAEIEALMGAFRQRAALFLPQNPSRGRTVEHGRYRVGGVPLHETSFARDPEHPARSSDVLELFGPSESHAVRCLPPGEALPEGGITLAGATSAGDVDVWARQVGPGVLPAGGADFFAAVLRNRGQMPVKHWRAVDQMSGPTLHVCGSTAGYAGELVDRSRRVGIPLCPMDDDPDAWAQATLEALRDRGRVLVTIGRPLDPTPGAARRLQAALAEVVARVLARERSIATVLLEGGATASAVCRRMGWGTLDVLGEWDVGVVQMRVPPGPDLIIKPGSYPWPEGIWDEASKRGS